ncbi:MAG: glycosyl hydrolase [Ignavibacteriae bacterium]|nr:glycosyl hydrolase [Ignavibacteriota bacterium]
MRTWIRYMHRSGSTRTPLLALLLLLSSWPAALEAGPARTPRSPDSLKYIVRPFYRYRADRQPGREVTMFMPGGHLQGTAEVDVRIGDTHEVTRLYGQRWEIDSVNVLLPPGVGVLRDTSIVIRFSTQGTAITQIVRIPAMRHWTVFVYPHSHVDIGYSNTHANVEFIHKRNIDRGRILAEQTNTYPPGARYVWNTEVMWPFERYFSGGTPSQQDTLVRAVKQGSLALDAAYVHVLTSNSSDEEMFQALRPRAEAVHRTGATIDTYVQVDIPGMAWGLVPALAHEGVRYIMLMPNGTRGNDSMVAELRQKPMWWVGQDGRSRVLFLNAGTYAVGLAKGRTTGRPWFGQRDKDKIPLEIRTARPREHFLDTHLFRELPHFEATHHPYDLFVVTWAMWDNALLDADLPDAVRSWNAEYAYPHLEIASAHTIMSAFEERYGSQFPEVRGDFTEYWTDGFGTVAKEARMARNAKDRLLQAEILWPMLRPGRPAPRDQFDEAWRNVVMTTEHTFTYENPTEPYFQDAIWRMKQRYFQEADDRSKVLLDEALAPATDRSDGALGPGAGPSNGGVAVFNTNSWSHGGLVTLARSESQQGDRVVDSQGNAVPSQRLSTGELVFLASPVPAFGSLHFRVVPGNSPQPGGTTWSSAMLDNGAVQVGIDQRRGTITHLRDSGTGKDLANADLDGGINSFRWQPAKGEGPALPDSVISVRLSESGPVLGEVEIISLAPGCRSVIRRVRVIRGDRGVRFTNTVDKLPLLPKDGVHFGFPFRIPGGRARIDIPWGVMELQKDQWAAANRAWMVAQHFADVSNDSMGITWCSPDAPLTEYGGITANNTANWDGAGDIWPATYAPSTVLYSWAMNNHWFTNTPLTQDGPVTFRYALRTHGRFDAAAAYRFGRETAQPLVALATGRDPSIRPLVATANDRVAVTILKAAADGRSVIVRLRSFSEQEESVALSWPARMPRQVRVCELGEEPGARDAMRTVAVPPMGLVTLRAEW